MPFSLIKKKKKKRTFMNNFPLSLKKIYFSSWCIKLPENVTSLFILIPLCMPFAFNYSQIYGHTLFHTLSLSILDFRVPLRKCK